MKPENVLHKPTPPPNADRWHIQLQGHPEELLDALTVIADHEHEVIQTAQWLDDDEIVICLHWIDDVIRRLVEADIRNISDFIKIKQNGRTTCHGHNLKT